MQSSPTGGAHRGILHKSLRMRPGPDKHIIVLNSNHPETLATSLGSLTLGQATWWWSGFCR
eukprot:scaffold86303_cov22-Tisochrysis_lutea.AAC.1